MTPVPLDAAGSVAVWCGDQVTAGDGASDAAHRYSTLASTTFGLDERNYAQSGAGFAAGTTVSAQIDTAAGALPGVTVGYVFLMAGLLDSFGNIVSMQQTVADTITKAKRLFPGATIVVGAGPGCIPADADDTAVERQAHVLTAIRLAADAADVVCIPDMRAVCGSDPDLRANGISPNDAGHALLAQAVESTVREAQGEPLDTPVTSLTRKYTSGGNSWIAGQIQNRNRREAEKREANRPTGTELNQLTSKLDALTRAQGLQQVILRQQQEMLDRQQQQLKQQQDALAGQQEQLRQQQASLQSQQSQLESIVGQQGDTVSSLQSLTQQLQSQQSEIDTIQNQLLVTVGENFKRIFQRLNALDGLGE